MSVVEERDRTTHSAPFDETPADTPILWLAGSMGYNGDLMYFEPILSEFCRRFPNTRIAVDENFPCSKYPRISLWPVLTSRRQRVQVVPGNSYLDPHRPLPSLHTLREIWMGCATVVIVVEFAPLALAGIVLAKLRRKKIVLLVENDPSFRGASSDRLTTFVKYFASRLVDTVLTSNVRSRDFVVNRLGVAATKVLVGAYLTSDPSRSGTTFPLRNAVAQVPERRSDKVNILFLNSVTERKGLVYLVKAFSLLTTQTRARFFVHVAGDGDQMEAVQTEVHAHSLEEQFHFYGRVPFAQIGSFYDIADVYISPTLADYRSLGGFEALNCGLPILLSKYDGACDEVVTQGTNGWIFDPLDTAALATLLQTVADEPDTLGRFAKASLARAKQFKVECVVKNLAMAVGAAMRSK